MSCCRVMAHMVKQFALAARQGFMEFCAGGCSLGSQYLVQPNYHRSERLLWALIFLATSTGGFYLLTMYLKDYSQNVHRVVYEDHGRNEPFRFPSVGICEIGSTENLNAAERVINNTVFANYPNLVVDYSVFKHFVNVLTFQNLHNPRENIISSFINHTQTLPPTWRFVFDHLIDYRELVDQIRYSCKRFFHSCMWEEQPFRCCQEFREIPTTLGKCFILNSLQNYSKTTSRLLKRVHIYHEPYRLAITFNKPAQIFLLNQKDIPETITPTVRHSIVQRSVQLKLEFTIVPTINDRELEAISSTITKCVNSNESNVRSNQTFPYRSYTTCITDCFVTEQWKTCGCINLYHYKPNATNCNLTQYACLEKHGFINPQSMRPIRYPFCRHCQINCEDSEYILNNLYYTFNDSLQGRRSLELILLNFPTKHKRRQVIRQPEDKLVSLSGILCLFLGGNVVNIIEFLYLFWRALVRRPASTVQLVAGYP